MALQTVVNKVTLASTIIILSSLVVPLHAEDNNRQRSLRVTLACLVSLTSQQQNASDGELVVTQQLHKSLARSGISFQALPRMVCCSLFRARHQWR